MQTQNDLLMRAIHEDRVREYTHPLRRHVAELRDSRPRRESRLRTLLAAIGRPGRGATAASGAPCTTADGRVGRLAATYDGARRVFVCEVD